MKQNPHPSLANPSEPETIAPDNPPAAHASMLLENEKGDRIRNPRWQVVERVFRELNPGHFNSYACLSIPGNTFIQGLRGFNGYHLEWRITDPAGDYAHYRACYPGGSPKAFELKKHDFISDGEFRDLLHPEDVIDAFRSFHQDEGLPGFLEWRRIEI